MSYSNNFDSIKNMFQYRKSRVKFDLKNVDLDLMQNSSLFDRTLYLNRLTSTMIEAASANLFSSLDSDLDTKKFPIKQKNNHFQMFIMNKPTVRLEPIKEKSSKSQLEFRKETFQIKKEPLPYISPYRIHRLSRKPKTKTNQTNKFKTRNQKKLKEKSLEIDLNEEAENLEKLEQDAEDEKQLKLLDDMENGADVEDIDLTTDDWINVNPTEITKRYDMLRKYATAKINLLRKNYETLETNDKEKIEKLKKQYFDHKKLWETERLVLLNMKDMELKWDQERSDYLDQAELAYKLQIQAQDAAENAIKQLEDFITEDAKLDRENAENTIQILRERSRTYTSLSMGNKEDRLEDDLNQHISEKIQVVIDNHTIKFPNKISMDKIIDYINFESSNKYTLILSHASNTNSRPNTRNEKTSANSQSPNRNKSSLRYASRELTNISVASERKSSKYKKNDNDFEQNGDLVEQVLTKVITDDETMLTELRNTVKSRSSLRSKHLAQLEANKDKLNELKTLAAQKFIGMDQDVSFDEDLNRSHGPKRDATSERVKMASEIVLNRVASSKTAKSSINSSIISHPIFLEYIKVYDIVNSFKCLIQKNLPSSEKQTNYKKFYERLNGLKPIEYDQNLTITPQIINMTANIDTVLNEIKLIFSELIDENLALKYDLLDKDQQLVTRTRPSTGMNDEIEHILKEREIQLEEKEEALKELEKEINKKIEDSIGKNLENESINDDYKSLLAKYNSETKSLTDQIKSYKAEIENLQNRNYELIRSKSFVLPPIKRRSEDSNLTRLVMFTKLDAIQNEKRMKKGIFKGVLSESEFQNVKILMDSYIRMQENRLVNLLNFYLKSKHIQSIKENIHNENGDNINTDIFSEKMQSFHEKKVNNYMEKFKKLRESRVSLANKLNQALDDIEQQSGIFLVKPFFSYKGLDTSTQLKKINNISRSISARNMEIKPLVKNEQLDQVPLIYQRPALTDPNILSSRTLKKTSWNIEDSFVTRPGFYDSNKSGEEMGFILDTPKLLELDVNRVLIAQNKVSYSVGSNEKEQKNVRSYMAFSRPHGINKKELKQNSDIQLTRNSPSLPPIVSKKITNEDSNNIQSEISRKSSGEK